MTLLHPEIAPFSLQFLTHQMFNGFGAGNIGDELMMLGFLKLIKPCEGSAIEVWNESSLAIPWFPEKYHYLSWLNDRKCEQHVLSSQAVLLVGDTPVTELVGLDWPLRSLKKRLSYCHNAGIQVHAIGVGADQLKSPDAIKIFQEAFLPIVSWTVRSANCRRALMALGVPDNRIVIAADLAWLYEPGNDCTAWALSQWKLLGVDFNRPLIGVNVVREVWGNNTALYKNIAFALDRVVEKHHAQIAFMCNEVRDGEYFDHAAALSVMDMMEAPTIFLPNRYYHPNEMIGLLSQVGVSLSQRYHFTIQSVIAGTIPVSFARGQKLAVLIEELGMNSVGDMEKVNPDTICREVTDALERRDYWRSHLLQMKKHLRLRAMNNGCFIKQLSAAPVQPRYISTTTGSSGLVPSAMLGSLDEPESVSQDCWHFPLKISQLIQNRPLIMPERFLFIRPDTYGDIVLFEPVLRLLRLYKPDCEIFILVRKGYLDIAPMISADIQWLTVDANPYKMSPIECCDELKQLKLSLDAIEPGIVVAPLINKTWLEIVVASWYPKARKVALGDVVLDVSTVDLLNKYLQLDIKTIFTETIRISANMTEWENNLLLASGLCNQPISSCIPQLKLPNEAERQAASILGELKLLNKSWVACCPAGVSNVSIKKWPAEKYGQVVAWLKNEKNLDVCLLGHSNEQSILEAVREESGKHGYRPLMWLGNDGGISLLCSLLDKCEFYFGNDTGAMHMAGAMNRSVVALFAGGHWPRFKPAATRSIVIVQKLPCFGCNWMCHFSSAPCIGSIPVEKVTNILSEWIDSSVIQGRNEIDIQEFSDAAIEIIRQGAINIQTARIEQSDLRIQVIALTEQLRKSESDRQLRFEQIQELTDRLKESEADRSTRLEAISSIQKRLDEVDQERNNQVAELAELLRESESDRQLRFEQIQELTERLLESEADRSKRLEVINSIQKRLEEVEQERRNQIAALTERLTEAEQAYHALENSFIVRKARQMRLIDIGRLDSNVE